VNTSVFFIFINRRSNPFPDEYDLPPVAVVSSRGVNVSLAPVGVIQLNIKCWLWHTHTHTHNQSSDLPSQTAFMVIILRTFRGVWPNFSNVLYWN